MIISSFIGSVILLHLLLGDVDLQGVDVHHVDVKHFEEEWGDATVVTYDEEEWRALWTHIDPLPTTSMRMKMRLTSTTFKSQSENLRMSLESHLKTGF